MSLCTFSSQAVVKEKVAVDNLFIHEFMPHAPENCTKVYLLGLMFCSNAASADNSLEGFSKILGISVEQVQECFYWWKEQGLVQILDTIPMQVRYMPINSVMSTLKKYKADKYQSFNILAQEILKTRMISPTEYSIYYDLLERERMEQEALLMIMQYCVRLKGTSVGHAYITTVARNWAAEHVLTAEQVEQRIKEYEQATSSIAALFKALSIKRTPSIEEKDAFNKWLALGFDEQTIISIAKLLKKQKLVLSMEQLGKKLEQYQKMGIFTHVDALAYEEQKQNLYDIAFGIVKQLGLYFGDMDPVVQTYVAPWTNMGYDKDGLTQIAQFCFAKGYHTLAAMNNTVQKLFKLGIVSTQSINEYMGEVSANEEQIKQLLEKLGLSRKVNSYDRAFYKIWTENWQIPQELLDYGATLAKDKVQPTVYLNKVLASFYENKITTVEQAKSMPAPTAPQKQKVKGSYSQSQLNALFDSIEEVEV
jgi:hypothetical protein